MSGRALLVLGLLAAVAAYVWYGNKQSEVEELLNQVKTANTQVLMGGRSINWNTRELHAGDGRVVKVPDGYQFDMDRDCWVSEDGKQTLPLPEWARRKPGQKN